MIAACEKYFGYVGDGWGNLLVIVEEMSVARVLVLSVGILD